MTRRTAAENDRRLAQLGSDLALFYPGPAGWWEDADLRPAVERAEARSIDLDVVSGVTAADQLLRQPLEDAPG